MMIDFKLNCCKDSRRKNFMYISKHPKRMFYILLDRYWLTLRNETLILVFVANGIFFHSLVLFQCFLCKKNFFVQINYSIFH